MKKSFVLAAAALLFTLNLSAQTYVNLGAGRLSNVTQIKGSDRSQKSSNALVVGASHNFTLAGQFGLEAGLNYIYDFRNYKLQSIDDSVVEDHYHGLNLPIELNYKIELGSNIGLVILAGPVLNFGISDKEKTTIASKDMGTIDYYSNGSRKRFGVAGELGLAAEFAGCIRMKLGYQIGFTDLDKSDNSTYRKDMYCFSISYGF